MKYGFDGAGHVDGSDELQDCAAAGTAEVATTVAAANGRASAATRAMEEPI
jgi:hypothetical protein